MKNESVIEGKMKRKQQHFAARMTGVLLVLPLVLSGCGSTQSEEDKLIIVEQAPKAVEYSMVETVVGDVVQTKEIECDYQQIEDMDLFFPVSEKAVSKVYVKKGDSVTKGQLLAELEVGENVDERIKTLEYQIARNTLLLNHLNEDEENEIALRKTKYFASTEDTDENWEDFEDSLADYRRENEYKREDYQDKIALDTMELEKIRADIEQCYIYAGMDGTIFFIKPNLEEAVSREGEKIMTIVDATECIFVSDEMGYASYFTEDSELDAVIGSGNKAENRKLVPYKIEEWEEEMRFTFSEVVDSTSIAIGTKGTITLTIDKRENVLKIPTEAVHTADGKQYVYIVGEGNTREVKWIEAGFYGDTEVEIISGLTEGEKVILK